MTANSQELRAVVQTRQVEFLSGVRDELPILIGVIPFGMIYGVLALQAGIPTAAAQAMSSIVFAGSSQFIATQLIGAAVPAFILIATIGIVNLRHALYSASVEPYIRHLAIRWKMLLAYLLTDEAYAVVIIRYTRDEVAGIPADADDYRHWYFLGAGLALWSSWQLSTAAGILLGAVIPEAWGLDFTLALTFIALVVPALRDRAALTSAALAGLTAVLAAGLPYKLGLIAAALVGITAGMLMEARQ
jgi:4-azaleucine resistance transporter AzlC